MDHMKRVQIKMDQISMVQIKITSFLNNGFGLIKIIFD